MRVKLHTTQASLLPSGSENKLCNWRGHGGFLCHFLPVGSGFLEGVMGIFKIFLLLCSLLCKWTLIHHEMVLVKWRSLTYTGALIVPFQPHREKYTEEGEADQPARSEILLKYPGQVRLLFSERSLYLTFHLNSLWSWLKIWWHKFSIHTNVINCP